MNDETIKREPLYQVWAIDTETGETVPMPMFPKMGKEAVEMFASTARMQISLGRLRTYSDPRAIRCL